jgi:hypothetical protein
MKEQSEEYGGRILLGDKKIDPGWEGALLLPKATLVLIMDFSWDSLYICTYIYS